MITYGYFTSQSCTIQLSKNQDALLIPFSAGRRYVKEDNLLQKLQESGLNALVEDYLN